MAREIGTPIWQKDRERWVLRVQRDGKRKWFYSTTPGRRGQRECEQKAEAWVSGNMSENASVTVESVFMQWLEEVRETISDVSYRQYEMLGRIYILPEIGTLKCARLTNEQMFQNIINKAYKNGNNGKGLAKKTLNNLRGTIHTFLKYCRKRGLTQLHPENLSVPRRAASPNKKILQPDDIRMLFSRSTTRGRNGSEMPEWFVHAYRFQVLTGLRPGELLGLKWIDLSGSLMTIRRSIDNFGNITPGKNANARRTFALPSLAKSELEAQREMLKEADMQSDYIFSAPTGKPAQQQMYWAHLRRYCSHNGMTVVSPYELRHTWFSLNKALPSELVKQMGGHSESMDTFGTYGHSVQGEMEETARLIDGVMEDLLDCTLDCT